MRIERVKIQNYRQYHNIDIEFSKGSENDLQVFIGKNGVGKTNLLNAINWCLYGDEPHLSAESDRQPIVNKRTLHEASKDEIPSVLVEIQARGKKNSPIIFRRDKSYTISADRKKVHEHQAKFQVIVKDKKITMSSLKASKRYHWSNNSFQKQYESISFSMERGWKIILKQSLA